MAKFLSKIISILYQSNLPMNLLQTELLARPFKEKTFAGSNFRGLTKLYNVKNCIIVKFFVFHRYLL